MTQTKQYDSRTLEEARPKEYPDLLMDMRVLDFHTHYVGDPTKFDPTIAALFERIRSRQRFNQLEVGRSPGALLDYFDEAGIEKACLLAECGPPTFYSVTNELCLGFAAQAPDRLFVIGNVNPRIEKHVGRCTELLIRGGVKGLKIYGSDHNQDPFDPKLLPLYELCATHELPLMFHCGTKSRYPLANPRFGDPLYWEPLFAKYRTIPWVMAHGGKGGQHRECLRILGEYPNTYIELSDIDSGTLRELVCEELADRFIFGSDMPQFLDVAPLIGKVLNLPVSESAKRKILYDNGARLLRLESA